MLHSRRIQRSDQSHLSFTGVCNEAILACGLAAAAPTVAGHGKVVAPPVNAAGTIYSQNGTDSGIGIVSQNFESSFDIALIRDVCSGLDLRRG